MLAAVTAAIPALPGIWSLTPIGALIGLLILIGILQNTGRLYTRGSHMEIVKLHEQRHDENTKIIATKDATIEALTTQLGEMVKSGAITDDFFQKVDAILRRERGDDGTAG